MENKKIKEVIMKNTEIEKIREINNGIYVENFSFGYGDKPIFQNLSLQFKKGGKYAFTGFRLWKVCLVKTSVRLAGRI
ncbi:MAG: hypothetical protein NC313_00465 [Butyrivibrio sp.]|nr:hypothetical protein [Butyrivibrio sp.]